MDKLNVINKDALPRGNEINLKSYPAPLQKIALDRNIPTVKLCIFVYAIN